MSTITYSLCALVALLCTWLLLRRWHHDRHRLLLWSGICFGGFTLNNILLVLDKVVYPEVDLMIYRACVALLSVAVLLYGLIWDAQ